MPDLNFGQCLTLLVIGFIFALIVARALMAVVNRGFMVVDHAKKQFSEIIPGAGEGGKFTIGGFIGTLAQSILPTVTAKIQQALGVVPPQNPK